MLPAEATEQVELFQKCLAQLEDNHETLKAILSVPKVDELPALDRAQALVGLGQLVGALFVLHNKATGSQPSEQLQKEQERIKLYSKKVSKAISADELRKARPTVTLDIAAANRFIDHSIPDLTKEQRQKLKEATDNLKRKAEEDDSAPKKKGSQKGGKHAKDAALEFLQKLKEDMK